MSTYRQVDILGQNRHETHTKEVVGCRGIIIQNNQILLSYIKKSDWWMLPGGGLEPNETLSECCAREVHEETGYMVAPLHKYLEIHEYYQEYRYVSHYYVCQIIGEETQHLTDEEKKQGLVPAWLDLSTFIDIVSKHEDHASLSEFKRGAYLREYTAITEYLKQQT